MKKTTRTTFVLILVTLVLILNATPVLALHNQSDMDWIKCEINSFMQSHPVEFTLNDVSQTRTMTIPLSDGSSAIWTVSAELTEPIFQSSSNSRGTNLYNVYPGVWTFGQDIEYPLFGRVEQRAKVNVTSLATQIARFEITDTWVNTTPHFGVTVDRERAWIDGNYAKASITFMAADLVPVTWDPSLYFWSNLEAGILAMTYNVT